MCQRRGAGLADSQHIHAVDLTAGNAIGGAPVGKRAAGGGTGHSRSHAILVVLDHEQDRQVPEGRHVEALIDLALVDGAITEIGLADIRLVAISVGKGKTAANRHLRADDAVTAEKILLAAEHVHRAALAARIATLATCQFSHHTIGIHAAGQHVAVVAIGGDDSIAGLAD